MRIPPTTLLLTLSHLALCVIIFAAAHVLYTLARRIRIEHIRLFADPTLFSFNIHGIPAA